MVIRKRLPISGPAVAFVTTTVSDWQPIFADQRCARIAAEQLSETSEHFGVSIVAWVIMPSHIHLLLGFPKIEMMSRFVQTYKSLVARRLSPLIRQTGSVWKPRFDDVIIWSEKQFRVKAEYIHNNPVKAGLVEEAGAYRWSSAADWYDGTSGIVPVVKDWNWG